MTTLKFSTALDSLTTQYTSRLCGEASDIRESISIVDFYTKILYTLIIAESIASNASPLRVAAAPGFGTMLGIIRGTTKNSLADNVNWLAMALQNGSLEFLTALNEFRIPNKYSTFKSMRDQLSHGHALPTDGTLVDLTLTKLSTLRSSLHETILSKLGDTYFAVKRKKLVLEHKDHKDPIDLSYLWKITPEESIGLYSFYSSSAPHYIMPHGEIQPETDSKTAASFEKTILDKKHTGADLNKLVHETTRDIAAFTEDYTQPSYYFGDDADSGVLYISWTRSTSDANISRTDAFRIGGADLRKEWRSGRNGEWVSYADFLREIANWQVLARRIGIGLENFSKEREEEETSRLGILQKRHVRGPAKLKEIREDAHPHPPCNSFFELGPRIDIACETLKPSTAVFFIIGQAGLGKTDLMLTLAKERAAEVAQGENLTKPLYLFVSSTGRTLTSLEDAVNSALNITKLLSSHGAKALCRNGLLVLLVDGFDELLGSSGYENALGSLEPWFRELNGRGVLVASARSSYYLTQYRRSLRELVDLNVDHTLLEIQPWSKYDTKTYLKRCGIPDTTTNSLNERDWEILSVPFFAKAFSAWKDAPRENTKTLQPIFSIVINQYLQRESLKLKDPHQGELLSVPELQGLFSELAELMQLSKMREIDHQDMVTCAQQVLQTESIESARAGLTKRLYSLCGLGASTDTSKPNQFGFSHEILFDCFLSLALQNNTTADKNYTYLLNILEKSKINKTVFEWALEHSENSTTAFATKIEAVISEKNIGGILAENLGTLWVTILEKNKGVPPTKHANHLQLDVINLSSAGWEVLYAKNTTINHLILPPSGSQEIHIDNADIQHLDCESRDYICKNIHGAPTAKIHQIRAGDSFADTPTEVRNVLEDLALLKKNTSTRTSHIHDAAVFFLERLQLRPDVQIIVSKDKNTDDPRTAWSMRLGEDAWHQFLNALIEHKMARWEQIAASGKSKTRLVFIHSPSEILRRAPTNGEINNFWEGL